MATAMDSAEEQYVTGLVVAHFVLAAQRLGVETDPIMARHHISTEQHLQANSRLDGKRFDALLIDLMVSSADPLFGYHVGLQLPPGAYGVMGHLAMACSNFREGMELVSRFQALVGNMGWVEILEEEQGMRLIHHLTHENPVLRQQITQSLFALALRLVRVAMGDQSSSPLWVAFASNEPAPHISRELSSFAGCPVHWGRPYNAFMIPHELLDQPLSQVDDTLQAIMEKQAEAQLQAMNVEQTFSERVRQQLNVVLRNGVPRRAQVARSFDMAERTLDRRLNEENTSWQMLLDQVRAEKATEYLGEDGATVAAVATRLGFTDVRAFQRRFKIWTGLTPSAYRDAQSSRNGDGH